MAFNDQGERPPSILGGRDEFNPFEEMHKTLKDELEASTTPLMVFCGIALGVMALISMVWF